VLETLGTDFDQNYSILIDPGAIERFISSAALKKIKVKEVEEDEFKYVEITSNVKQKVGRKFIYYILNLGDFVPKVDIYVTILGSYDIVIGMDWLESHDSILNFKMKWLSLTEDLGQSRVIVGRNYGVSLRFVFFLQLQKSMCKGLKLYAILSLNEKEKEEGIENLLLVQEFADVFLEYLPGLPPDRELEFTIDLKTRTEYITRMPYWMSTLEL
jgi:hypothetical protein